MASIDYLNETMFYSIILFYTYTDKYNTYICIYIKKLICVCVFILPIIKTMQPLVKFN